MTIDFPERYPQGCYMGYRRNSQCTYLASAKDLFDVSDLDTPPTRLDISNNAITGSIPSEIGQMSSLRRVLAQNNKLVGTLPSEMNRMDPNLQLNLTGNL